MDYDWNALSQDLRERANEVYLRTGYDAGILHDVAYRLEVDRERIDQADMIINEAVAWFEQNRPQWGPGTLPTWYVDATRLAGRKP